VSNGDGMVHGLRPLRGALCIVALGAAITLPGLFTRDLWVPDEPRSMEIVREMLTRGDFVVLRLDGEAYSEKPPLYFWLSGLLWRAGLGLSAGRLVAAGASVATLLLVYGLGRRLLGAPGGLLAAGATATLFLFVAVSKVTRMDSLLAFFIAAALAAGTLALTRNTSRTRLCWLAFYLAAALGILTKGPIAIILPGLILLAFAALNWRRVSLGGWEHLAGAALLAAIVGAWFALAWTHGGRDYALTVLVRQTSGRLVDSYSHAYPPYYYLVRAPLLFAPWFLFLIPATAQAVLDWRRKGDMAAALAVLWFGGMFLLFSAASGKGRLYLAPLLPGAGLLAGRYFLLAARSGQPWPRLHKWLSAATFALVGVLAAAALGLVTLGPDLAKRAYAHEPVVQQQSAAMASGRNIALAAATFVALLALAAAGAWLGMRRPRSLAMPAALVGVGLVASLYVDLVVCPSWNGAKPGRDFALQVAPILRQAQRVCTLEQNYYGVFNLYAGLDSIPVLRGAEQLAEALKSPEHVVVIMKEKQYQQMQPRLPADARVLARERLAYWRVVLVSNRGEAAAP